VPELGEIAVYLGLDVGKDEHHAVALAPNGKKLHDRTLPNSEPKLRALFAKLARHGQILVAVDQPASIGALPVTVARDAGCLVAYLPGLTMRHIADLYPGEAKTDARDAHIIADAARTMPRTLRDLEPDDESIAALHMLLGFDDDLTAEATRTSNASSARACTTPPSWRCWSTTAPRPRSTPPESSSSPPCCAPTHPGWPPAWPPRSSPPSTSRASRSRHRRRRDHPAQPRGIATHHP